MSRSRNNEKSEWLHIDFVKRLKKIKAHKMLKEQKEISIAKITEEMVKLPSFEKLEKELLQDQTLKIKLDTKRLLK